jgi:hypothetical protein
MGLVCSRAAGRFGKRKLRMIVTTIKTRTRVYFGNRRINVSNRFRPMTALVMGGRV